mmetsp:Transcript_1900/g.4235  ORF Transcript_1900/g.4235 Transcript_1900/m.4235 type:complete len:207 (-) Transcript_1900:363-983(-)
MERHRRHRIQMPSERLPQLEPIHRRRVELELRVWVDDRVVRRQLRVASLLAPRLLRPSVGRWQLLLLQLLHRLFQSRHARTHPVALEPHQHLLLHRHLVLALQLRQRWLVRKVVLPQSLQVCGQLVLLLNDPFVMHAVEVALLAELVPCPLRLRRNVPHLVQLLPQVHHLLVQLLIPQVDVGHRRGVLLAQLPLRLELVPLRIEAV